MTSSGESDLLISFPFLGVRDIVDEILSEKAKEQHLQHQVQVRPSRTVSTSTTDTTTPSYDTLLYAFRLRHRNFRGAAMALHEHLERIKSSPSSSFLSTLPKRGTVNTSKGGGTTKGSKSDTSEDSEEAKNKLVTRTYLALINLLAAMDPEQAWFIIDIPQHVPSSVTANGDDDSVNDLQMGGSKSTRAFLHFF